MHKKSLLCESLSLPSPDACPRSNPPCWGFLEDYAFVVRGLLDLYEASLESAWLEWALRLQDTQDRLFWDSRGGGYFCSEAELGAGLPLRLKDGQWGSAELACFPGPTWGLVFPVGGISSVWW